MRIMLLAALLALPAMLAGPTDARAGALKQVAPQAATDLKQQVQYKRVGKGRRYGSGRFAGRSRGFRRGARVRGRGHARGKVVPIPRYRRLYKPGHFNPAGTSASTVVGGKRFSYGQYDPKPYAPRNRVGTAAAARALRPFAPKVYRYKPYNYVPYQYKPYGLPPKGN